MTTTSYWFNRLTRRSMLRGAAAGAAALGAASLIACGDDDKAGSQSSGNEIRESDRKDTSARAKPGGNWGFFLNADPANLDTIASAAASTQNFGAYSYSRLLKWKPGIEKPANGEIEGDLVESWEMSPDQLRLTLKLKPNAGTDPRPPLNGRMMASEDVKFSFNKFLALSSYASNLFNSKSPSAPITQIQYPDSRTAVIQMAFPTAAIYDALAEFGGFYVMPTEADGKFNPRSEAHGSGPWFLKSYSPSSVAEFARNPNWYVKGRPFLDGITRPVVSEYSTQLAQFNAGRIWSDVVRADDVPTVKKSHPELLLYSGEFAGSAQTIYFGWNGPFKDERVRRAASMSIDRELYAETFSGNEKLEKEGLPTRLAYNTNIGAGWGPWWLDPFGKEMGDASKNYTRNVPEAKKLMAAAGFASGFDSDFHTISGATYGTDWQRQMEVLLAMIAESGIKFKLLLEDYATVYIPTYQYSKGLFDGASAMPGGVRADAGQMLQIFYHSDGSASRIPPKANPAMDSLIERQLREPDREKRLALTHEIQRTLAKGMDALPVGFQAAPYNLVWPWLQNRGAYRSWVSGGGAASTEVYPFLWFDETKKTS